MGPLIDLLALLQCVNMATLQKIREYDGPHSNFKARQWNTTGNWMRVA